MSRCRSRIDAGFRLFAAAARMLGLVALPFCDGTWCVEKFSPLVFSSCAQLANLRGEVMKPHVIIGMDPADLNEQQWKWQIEPPPKRTKKQWPDERLPLAFQKIRFGEKINPQPQFSRIDIDYEEEK
jgi:hypothetical protein